MTYKDSAITENMFSYWLSTYKSDFLSYYNSSFESEEFWNSPATADMTAEEYAMDIIIQNIKYTLVGIQLFREYALKIPAELTEAINSDINEKIEYFGGRSELNVELSAFGINIDMLRDIYIAEEKLYAVYDYLYGTNGTEKVSDAKVDEYYKSNYSRIKYIMVNTFEKPAYNEDGSQKYDSEGLRVTEPLSEEELAAKHEKINEIMMCVNAGDEFDDIMAQFNEVDMSGYPNGFYVSGNELGIFGFAMVNEVAAMQVGEVRKISDNVVTCIVQKCPLIERSAFTDRDLEQLESLEDNCIQQEYEKKFSAFADEIVVDEETLSRFSIRLAAPNSYF